MATLLLVGLLRPEPIDLAPRPDDATTPSVPVGPSTIVLIGPSGPDFFSPDDLTAAIPAPDSAGDPAPILVGPAATPMPGGDPAAISRSLRAADPGTPSSVVQAAILGREGLRRVIWIDDAPPTPALQQRLAAAGIDWQGIELPRTTVEADWWLAPLDIHPGTTYRGERVRVTTRLRWLGPTDRPSLEGWEYRVRWIWDEESTIGEQRWLPIPADGRIVEETTVLRAQTPPDAGRISSVAIDVRGPDTELRRRSGIVVEPEPRWFVMPPPEGSDAGTATADLIQTARQSGLVATRSPELPEDLWAYAGGWMPLARFAELSPEQRDRLRRWIDAGASLVMTSPTSDAPGSLPAIIWPRWLPAVPGRMAEPDPRAGVDGGQAIDRSERDVNVARATVLFLVDNSGSMSREVGRGSRYEYVRAAVRGSLENLTARDRIAVIFFNESATGRFGPVDATPANLAELDRELRNYPGPGGGTSIVKACEAAETLLAQSPSRQKHLVLLSDGADASAIADFDGIGRRLEQAGITVSVVGVGMGRDDDTLRALRSRDGGIWLFTEESREQYEVELPAFFTRAIEVAQRRGDEDIRDVENDEGNLASGAFAVERVGGGARFLAGDSALPRVHRVRSIDPTSRSEVLLRWRSGSRSGALLVQARYGLGRIGIWGTEPSLRAIPSWVADRRWPEILGRWWREWADPQPGPIALGEETWDAEGGLSLRPIPLDDGAAVTDARLRLLEVPGTPIDTLPGTADSSGRYRFDLRKSAEDRAAAWELQVQREGDPAWVSVARRPLPAADRAHADWDDAAVSPLRERELIRPFEPDAGIAPPAVSADPNAANGAPPDLPQRHGPPGWIVPVLLVMLLAYLGDVYARR